MLKFQPENKEFLKTRIGKVLKRKYNAAVLTDDRPGNKRENIFDFEDGVRIIISLDYIGDNEYIHFSGSIDKNIIKENVGSESILEIMTNKVEFLFNNNLIKFDFVGITKGGIPHWCIKGNDAEKLLNKIISKGIYTALVIIGILFAAFLMWQIFSEIIELKK